MRKTFFVLLGMIILILLISTVVNAQLAFDSIDVNLDVKKYASINHDRNPQEKGLNFLNIEGSTGIYHTNKYFHWEQYLVDTWGGIGKLIPFQIEMVKDKA